MRMKELRRRSPVGQLNFGAGGISKNKFDGGAVWFLISALGQKDGAVFRTTQILPQREAPFDELAFPLFPGFRHEAPPPDEWAERALLYPRSKAGCCCSKGQVAVLVNLAAV